MSDTTRLPSGIAFAPTENPAQSQVQAIMQAAMGMPIPRFYVNSLGLAMTPTDLIVTLIWNGQPVCNLNLSLPIAKGFSEDLAKAVLEYERASGQTVQSAGEIGAAMQRAHSASAVTPPRGNP
jgi:hypothetical protein